MLSEGFEPTIQDIKRLQAFALDRIATGIGVGEVRQFLVRNVGLVKVELSEIGPPRDPRNLRLPGFSDR